MELAGIHGHIVISITPSKYHRILGWYSAVVPAIIDICFIVDWATVIVFALHLEIDRRVRDELAAAVSRGYVASYCDVICPFSPGLVGGRDFYSNLQGVDCYVDIVKAAVGYIITFMCCVFEFDKPFLRTWQVTART